MAFDPAKPVEGSDLDAVEMRDQLNALKALIDAQAAEIAVLQQEFSNVTLPFMVADTNGNLLWLWTGANPAQWHIDCGEGPGGDWEEWETVDGAQRIEPNVDRGTKYRVVGQDNQGVNVTPWSNVVSL